MIAGLLGATCGCTDAPGLDAGPPVGQDAGPVEDAGRDAGLSDAQPGDAGEGLGPDEVRIESGVVRGVAQDDLRVFLGIPYAAPPVGPLRFAPPVPAEPWAEPLAASDFGPDCSQLDTRGAAVGAEDCLTLNVWSHLADGPRPVMVWIHGGGYVQGGSSRLIYDGTDLARDGEVVVVSINYRLGTLGFLATDALRAESPQNIAGNYGTQDQIWALRWVQDNIEAFGGDPGQVTLFGESAGGVSVCTMLGSPRAAGLFHRAIIQSGGGCYSLARLSGPGPGPSALEIGGQLTAAVQCDTAPDPVACLRGLPAAQLTEALAQIPRSGVGLPDVGPNIDGVILPAQPYAVVQQGAGSEVPVLMGSNADEAVNFVGSLPVPDRAAFERLVQAAVGPALGPQVIALYPEAEFSDPKLAYLAAFGDLGFNCPAQSFAALTAAGAAPSYLYYFPHVLTGRLGADGATHGSEIPFVFGTIDVSPAYRPTPEDRVVSAAMLAAWASFAHSGTPSTEPTWPAYDPSDPQIMRFEAPLSVDTTFRGGRCDTLRNLGLVP